MIEGVVIKKLIVRNDIPDAHQPGVVPGFLMEILRDDDKLLRRFGQTTMTVAHEGVIKAFHWHRRQDDLWFVATGKARVVLHDNRKKSKTFGKTQTLTAGANDYKLILIPRGVVHGYQVLSPEPVMLFYHTTESYKPAAPDEQRILFDDPKIGFDWSVSH